uniref:DNA 3'-5' helicase n=1 Tax=Merkel cell polyomavirus TaxID=493803 RepID=B8ZX56_9POLY|nr:large T antigen [Merkel cell polyomavirus]
MDLVLNRKEREALCKLLEIAPNCYGNIPLMKAAFKRSCLKHHPDKGGNPVIMMELNTLWSKFQQNIHKLRSDFSMFDEVDEAPIYGTTKFKEWWRSGGFSFGKAYEYGPNPHGTNSRSRKPSSNASRGAPSGSSPPHSQSSSSGYGSFSASQASDSQSRGPDIPPEHHEEPTSSSGSSSREETTNSGRESSTPNGTSVPRNSSRTDGTWEDLFCDESLSSPEPPSSSEEPEEPPSSRSSPRQPPSSSAEEASSSQFTDEEYRSSSFTTPKTPPPFSRKRKFGGSRSSASSASSASFTSTPPKPKRNRETPVPTDFPIDLSDYLSHAVYSNKTVSCFAIYTTSDKAIELYDKIEKFKVDFKSRHACELGCILLFITLSKHRVSAIKNFCSTLCTISFLICKGVNKMPEVYNNLCKPPYKLLQENKPLLNYEFQEKEKEASCNWNLVAEFACEYELDDHFIILAHYLDFAKPFPCQKCENRSRLKPHKAHEAHHSNAKLFYESKSQKTICQQAADTVLAKRRLEMLEMTRTEMLCKKFKKHLERLRDLDTIDLLYYMGGVAWYCCLFEEFEKKLQKIIQLLTENIPKYRNIWLKGPINSGKTSFAAALIDLLEGKALNINCPSDKLPFELGCALDKFMVVFEDVKGQNSLNKDLQPGQGINNLDNLRDHLDGAVAVSLEKRHVNKKHQIFPPCIVTANDYFIPKTLIARFSYTLHFSPKANLRDSLDQNMEIRKRRILQSGTTLLLCLIWCLPDTTFKPCLQEEIKNWKQILQSEISYGKFCQMIENVEAGQDPLLNILIEEEGPEETEETQDSGTFSQ